jgi:hypothetical protein
VQLAPPQLPVMSSSFVTIYCIGPDSFRRYRLVLVANCALSLPARVLSQADGRIWEVALGSEFVDIAVKDQSPQVDKRVKLLLSKLVHAARDR